MSLGKKIFSCHYNLKTMKEKYTADDIKSLDGGSHVRMRPEMYFEKCYTEQSLNSIVFEVLCHAFDEYLDGNCTEIKLSFSFVMLLMNI
ncbi:hypothetical protein [Flavobacterium sp.]|uniref:hypothetical protein n=1 Tax=Flavobacterium sp. TaxID=239 RepID=UPI004047A065